MPSSSFESPFLKYDKNTDIATIRKQKGSSETFDVKFDDIRPLNEPSHIDKIVIEKLHIFQKLPEIFFLFYGHQGCSKWDLCRRSASHYIAFLASTFLRKAYTDVDPNKKERKFNLKVLIRDYNVRISEVKLGRNYQDKLKVLMEGLETPINKLLLKDRLEAHYKIVFVELSEELEENPKLADVLSPPTRRIKSGVFLCTSQLLPCTDEIEY